MIFFTAAAQLLFPATSNPSSDQDPRKDLFRKARWTVEAKGKHLFFSVLSSRRLGARRLAHLASEIEEARGAGFEVALNCAPGAALESLRKVHFHRFVEVLPTRDAARRWAFGAEHAGAQRAA
ncbi:MAG: hypothetical protein AAGM22_06425 [Acidobacteriota bacterium]